MSQDEFQFITYEAGILRSVTYGIEPDDTQDITDVELTFDSGIWLISVDANEDTVVVTKRSRTSATDMMISDASQDLPWSDALSSSVRWMWTLKNQQGYLDAVQLEFVNVDSRHYTTVQLVAMASGLQIKSVHTVRPVRI